MKIIIAYPFALLLIAIVMNILVFEIKSYAISLPSIEYIRALVIASVLLIINHAWLMTSTEITRLRYKMFSTPEEWAANGTNQEDAPVK